MPADPSPFALVVRFTLRPGSEAEFDALVAETAAGVRAHEPGTLIYACHQVDGRPLERIFYEMYADRAAFEAHEAGGHTRKFLAERTALLESTEVDFLHLNDGKTPLSQRMAAVVRRTQEELSRAQERGRTVHAQLEAIAHFDTAWALIESSESARAAVHRLTELLDLDESEATSVLDMQLSRLAAWQRRRLAAEYKGLPAQIADYESILASRERQREIAAAELAEADTPDDGPVPA